MATEIRLADLEVRISANMDQIDKDFKHTEEKAATAGKKTAKSFADGLNERLKDERARIRAEGQKAGEEFSGGMASSLKGIERAVKGIFAIQAVQFVVRSVGAAIGALRDMAREAEDVARSYLQLQSASKLFGVSQADLTALSTKARVEYRLGAQAANELAVQTTKMAARAGDAKKSQDLLSAALDLGAAQGYDAKQVALALEQTLRGLDEGTDKLLQKNPSQVYAEYARSIGVGVASLTDLQQKQALVNAILEAGGKVTGAYTDFIKSDIGAQAVWRNTIEQSRQTIGTVFIPVLNNLAAVLSGPLASGLRLVIDLLETMLDPAERAINRLQRMGASAETIAPLIARNNIREGQEEVERLRRQAETMAADLTRSQTSSDYRYRYAGAHERGQRRNPLTGRSSLEEIQSELDIETKAAEEAAQKGDRAASDIHTKRMERIRELLATTRQILVTEEGIRATQGNLGNLEERARKQQEIEGLTRQIAENEQNQSAGMDAVNAQLAKRREALQKEIGQLTDPTPGKAQPLSAAEEARIKKAKQLVDAWKELQLSELQAKIEKWKEFEAAARAIGDSRAAEEIKQQRIQLELTQAALDKLARTGFGPLKDMMSPSKSNILGQFKAALPEVAGLLADFTRQYQGSVGRAREQLARGLISNKEFQRREKEAAGQLNARILEYLTFLRDVGRLTSAEFAELSGALKETDTDAKKLHDKLASFAAVAQGVLSVADAFGILDDKSRKALEGIVEGIEGVSRIAAGDIIGGTIQTIGGVAKLASGIFGKSALDREREQAVKQNTEAIRKMTLEFQHFRATGSVLSRARAAAGQAAAGGGMAPWEFGLTGDQLDAIAQQYGITLRDSKNRYIQDAFKQLADALDLAIGSLTGFRDSLEDQREEIDLENDIMDRSIDAQSKLVDSYKLLQKFSPEIVDKYFSGADPSTPEGRQTIEAGMRALFEAFRSGDLEIGGLTREEFLQLMRDMEASLDELGVGGAGGVTSTGTAATRLSVSITELQANELLRLEATQTDHLAAMRRIMEGGGPQRITPEGLTLGAGATTITVDLRGLAINITAGAGANKETLAEGGAAAGRAFGDSFTERLQAAYRGAGGAGQPRVSVRTRGGGGVPQ